MSAAISTGAQMQLKCGRAVSVYCGHYLCDTGTGISQLKCKSLFLEVNYKWRKQGYRVALSFRRLIQDLFLSGLNCSHTVIEGNKGLLRQADYKVQVNNALKAVPE